MAKKKKSKTELHLTALKDHHAWMEQEYKNVSEQRKHLGERLEFLRLEMDASATEIEDLEE